MQIAQNLLHGHSRVQHFPVSFFAAVMGTAGLGIALERGAQVVPLLRPLSLAMVAVASLGFLVLLAVYGAKLVTHRAEVRLEFVHPVRLHFFPTISISLLLLSIAFFRIEPNVALMLLVIGAPLHLMFTLTVLDQWLHRESFQVPHLNPAWFIPIVGNLVVPLAAAPLGYTEIGWFYFAIGIVFWLPMFAIILNRVLFHQPLPERMAPTLFILIAPPAVAFLAYLRLTGSLDAFARILYFFALFLTLFLATQVPRLVRMPFYLSWWAYSFPLAAMTIASYAMHEKSGLPAYLLIAHGLLAITACVVAGLALRTGLAATRHELCVPE
ncbi:MAG: C4-dicarboxylate ABC transporter [Rhizobiales bacterium 12-68-15]|nr:MAG: C4-dicarboxylate ABC transporter [Rhizobiales bacterium 12-68-15]